MDLRLMNRRTFLQAAGVGVAGLALGSLDIARIEAQSGLADGRRGVVATDTLNVRGGPGTGEPVVGALSEGTGVDLLGPSADGAWWRVAADSTVGWVNGGYLQPDDAAPSTGLFDLDLALPFGRQLTDVWCEAADIEMWMGYHGEAEDVPSQARQQRIWDWEIAHNAGFTVAQWDCSPYAAASAAHNQMPDKGFDHFLYDDPGAGSRMLAWLLASPAHQEPSIALIWRGAHYVLVRGVRAIGDPGQDPDAAQILGFYIADPNRADRRWYGSDRFIPLDSWMGELFLPATYRTPHSGVPGDPWQDRFVTIQRTIAVDGPTDAGQTNATPTTYA